MTLAEQLTPIVQAITRSLAQIKQRLDDQAQRLDDQAQTIDTVSATAEQLATEKQALQDEVTRLQGLAAAGGAGTPELVVAMQALLAQAQALGGDTTTQPVKAPPMTTDPVSVPQAA